MSRMVNRAEVPYSKYFGDYKPSPLSVAVDEIYMLRALAAHVAGSLQADLGMASLPASVRKRHEELLESLQRAVEGEALYGLFDPKPALSAMNASEQLSNAGWAENQGVTL